MPARTMRNRRSVPNYYAKNINKSQQQNDTHNTSEIQPPARVSLKRKSTSSTTSNMSSANSELVKNVDSNKKVKIQTTPQINRKNNSRKSKTANEEKQEDNENIENNQESDTESTLSDDDDLLKEIDLDYLKLNWGNYLIRKENVCNECEMPGDLIDCQGTCQNSFHLDCAGMLNEPPNGCFKCDECITGQHTCFLCKKIKSPNDNSTMTKKCASNSCGRYYHDECAKSNPLFRNESSSTSGSSKFLCPSHTCGTCWAENKSSKNNDENNHQSMTAQKGRFWKCIRCPNAYHIGDFCIPAGSVFLAGCNIICPDHFQPVKGQSHHNRVNVTWCFVCCKSHDLIGCSKCPAAYHLNCMDNPPSDIVIPASLKQKFEANNKQLSPNHNGNNNASNDHSPSSEHSACTFSSSNTIISANSVLSTNWVCEDCLIGKRPLNGQIVWAKVGKKKILFIGVKELLSA
jgi:hypothetical protein